MQKALRILVLGAGAWGTAVAMAAARHPSGHRVTLWARDAQQADNMQSCRVNTVYLPELLMPQSLQVVSGAMHVLANNADLIILATPVSALRDMLRQLASVNVPVVWLCKGVEPAGAGSGSGGSGLLPHEVQAEVAAGIRCGVLSGPSFAQEVAHGLPTALVAASAEPDVRQMLVEGFHSSTMRIYANDDVIGVEVGGAVKNVLAIATGFCDGLELGLNARAALITRGLAEMTRLGIALGARAETFMGLTGMGDLVLTATGNLSRNRRVGLLLAEGKGLGEVLQSLGHVAEGVHCAHAVVQKARAAGVEMPIAESVVQLLQGQTSPRQIVEDLLARDPAREYGGNLSHL